MPMDFAPSKREDEFRYSRRESRNREGRHRGSQSTGSTPAAACSSFHHEFSNGASSNNTKIQYIYNVTRILSALHFIYTYQHQYQSSLVVSKESKFVLWLMLQKEGFWRGERGGSERLSAARIGKRPLHSGTYRASPCIAGRTEQAPA
ncbi:hypothetical protein ACHAW6_006872 [Cyclotella cf. meneghiniana]